MDFTPPHIVPEVFGTVGDNDWYVSDLTIAFTVTDDESPILSTSGCESTNIFREALIYSEAAVPTQAKSES